MGHTQIVTAKDLTTYAKTRDSEAAIPELIWRLVKDSVSDLTTCRIPYGDAINQPGWDGLVETENGFRQFVPKQKSFWEIGTGGHLLNKATSDFEKRTAQMSPEERAEADYVFATPNIWSEPSQRKWISQRKDRGWHAIKILDSVQLADWLREFPAIGRWLLKKMGFNISNSGFTTPVEHWENLQTFTHTGDPPLPPKLFLAGREHACLELGKLFRGEIDQLVLAMENEQDAADFVAAFLFSLDPETSRSFSSKCLFVEDEDAWLSLTSLQTRHVLLANQKLDLEFSGERFHAEAKRNGHAIVICLSGAWADGSDKVIAIRSPSEAAIKTALLNGGYTDERASKLAGAGASCLAALKRHLRGLGELPPYVTWESVRVLAQAGLIGRWSGENPADRAALEILLGKSYGEWVESVRPEALRSDTPLIQRNEKWKIISRGEAWSAMGPRLNNDDLDRFHKAALAVLGERDPKLDLPPDERFAASIRGKVLRYSQLLRRGMAETLALLGSRPGALSSCSQEKAETIALLTVRELLEGADWVMWASLDSHLPMLAEAAPEAFLDAVESALSDSAANPFKEVFAQERPGITGRNYMSGLLWALETLAWHPDFLVRVTVLLGELAAIDPGGNWANRPANSLAEIFLPWYPQTCAPIPKRKSAVETLLHEQPGVGWKLLMALLPQTHGFSMGSRKPAWREFIPEGWSEGVTDREYWEQTVAYAELAVSAAATELSKLAELIDRLPDLPNPTYSRVLEHLASPSVLGLSESDRLPLWEALVDLAAKHRKFPDAQWAIPQEAVTGIEQTAAKLAPTASNLIHRRLFSDRDFFLFEESGEYEEQRTKLTIRRQEAVREILNAHQIAGLLDFAQHVASPDKVGHALGCVESEPADTILLPDYLGIPDKVFSSFISGFIWGRFWTRSWSWVDAMVKRTWDIEQKATFFALLPFVQEAWQRAEQFLGNDVAAYWKKANVTIWGPKEHLLEAVTELLKHGRPSASLACLHRLAREKATFPPELVVRALLESLMVEEAARSLDHHDALELIKWLQENDNTDTNALFSIEWAYLPLLDYRLGGEPKTLERRLAADPSFFCELIGLVFRPENELRTQRQPTEQEKNIAQNAYHLLRSWTAVPGIKSDGSLDSGAFVNWLAEVKQRTKESGHLRIAMDQLGGVLSYAPADPDGLWIHKTIAGTLNSKDATEMRLGFTCRLFNRRGVHGYTAGREEREIAARYQEKANALDQAGYHRFATAIRDLAKSYERDAEREAQESPYEN